MPKKLNKVVNGITKKNTTRTKKIELKNKLYAKAKKVIYSKELLERNKSKAKKVSKVKTSKPRAKKISYLSEYYDLPTNYEQTQVKVLAQTPTCLFVYWQLSHDFVDSYKQKYGENFFNDTYPVLYITNLDKNYTFEEVINDFANSWYIHIDDANCKYKVELGRKPSYKNENISKDYVFIGTSNAIQVPNDKILMDTLNGKAYFRNIKTNTKYIKSVPFNKNLYKDIDFNENKVELSSSSNM